MSEILVQKYDTGVKIFKTRGAEGFDVYLTCKPSGDICLCSDSLYIATTHAENLNTIERGEPWPEA